jgi:hypothetical protein
LDEPGGTILFFTHKLQHTFISGTEGGILLHTLESPFKL